MYTVVKVSELFKNFKELDFNNELRSSDVDTYDSRVWIPNHNTELINKIGTVKKLTSKLFVSDKIITWDGIKGCYMFTSEDLTKEVRDSLKRDYNIAVVYLETVRDGSFVITGIDYNENSKFLFEEIRALIGLD